jgi:peptidoglycan-associated lipoprotein
MNKAPFAVLILAAAVGCATTETPQEPTPAPAPGTSASTPGTASSPQVGRGVDVRPSPGTAPGMQSGTGMGGPELKRSVYFEFDKYDVKPEYRGLVEANARWLKANPKAKLVVEGNTDERGSREYNVALGQRRAESVAKMMQLLGARADQVEAVSYGEEKPRSAGHDETAWTENRRSDFAQR